MTKKTTIYDIAKKLDITAATVSRALNNNPKISPSTSKLVLDTALEMNYKRNKLAASLQSGKSNNVGVIVPRINTNFLASVIRGIEEELQPEGYQVIICQSHEDEKTEIECINTLLNAQVDGIMMSVTNTSEENYKLIERAVQKNVPFIFFDRKLNIKGVSSVIINDYEIAYRATSQLINEGCNKIAHFSGNREIQIYENRFNGYKQALLDNNIEFNEDYVIRTKSNFEAGSESMIQLLKLENPPNAIFSASDFAIIGAIQELKNSGIKIPEDFCVFGFGNEPFTNFMEVSSIDQSPIEMGKMAARVFLEQINTPGNLKMEKKVIIKSELKIRKSSLRNSIQTLKTV